MLHPGRTYSKKGHSQRVETKWTTTFGWWWSLEKSSPLQSPQPKNPSDSHNLQNPFTCEMLLNLPHVLIFDLDLLLPNVKNTCFAFSFLFCDEKIDYDYYLITKRFVKILFLCSFFLLWWKTVYFWSLLTLKFHSTFFFPSGGFHAQELDIHPIKLFGFPLKFWINVWWCYHRVGFECKKQKHFVKKTRSLDFGQIWVNVRTGEHIGISPLTEKNFKPKGSAVSEHFLLCNHSPFFENFSLLTKENKKFLLEVKESLLIMRD